MWVDIVQGAQASTRPFNTRKQVQMSTPSHLRPVPPVVNRIWSFMIRSGLGPKTMILLTVYGRKTGKPYTTPVALITLNGEQFVVAPYGEVNWVHNVRATQKVSVRQGTQVWEARAEEMPSSQVGPVLKKYVAEHVVTQSYFSARPNSPAEEFEKEASRHPVFRLQRV